MTLRPHPFIDLDRTDRADWVAELCARRAAEPSVGGPPFPSLVAGQNASDWLLRQLELLKGSGKRERLRETAVELVETQATRMPSRDRIQVLGMLLRTADLAGFQEIAPTLAEWVRQGWIDRGQTYRQGSEDVPLRRTVWSLLIGWGRLEGLGPQLVRDLARLAKSDEDGTAQICFAALGQHDPERALYTIPLTVRWPEVFWVRTMSQFFGSVGPPVLLERKYRRAWAHCLGKCLYDPEIEHYVRKLYMLRYVDGSRAYRLCNALENAEIHIKTYGSSAELEWQGLRLKVDIDEYTEPIKDSAGWIQTLPMGTSVADLAAYDYA